MPIKKVSLLKRSLFLIINILLFNAVYITALVFYFHLFPEFAREHVNIRFTSILFEVSVIPAIWAMMPICLERTLYQDRNILICLRATSLQLLVMLVLLWIADLEVFKFAQIVLYYCYCTAVITVSMVLYRVIVKRTMRSGADRVNIIIVGDSSTAQALSDQFSRDKEYGYNLLGYVGSQANKSRMHAKWIGETVDLQSVIEQYPLDELYYIVNDGEDNHLQEIVALCNNNFVKPYFVPAMGTLSLKRYMLAGGSRGFLILAFRGERLEKPVNRFIKRVFDIIVSSIALIVLAIPVFLPVALAIKLTSPGPVFFRQKRNGYHGKEFTCYKFRSMVVNAQSNTAATERNDNRITAIGHFIRRTSIDELPQFFNVLIGNMSVVGPRPHILKQTEVYRNLLNNYMVRHLIKPGITGWAQVNKLRGTTETLDMMEARVKADIWYIENWTLILDIKIVLSTIYNVLFTHEEGAY